jgi:hypothetical protein
MVVWGIEGLDWDVRMMMSAVVLCAVKPVIVPLL